MIRWLRLDYSWPALVGFTGPALASILDGKAPWWYWPAGLLSLALFVRGVVALGEWIRGRRRA